MAKVSLHIVSWNSMRFLPDALASIFAQTYRDIQVVIVDNASTDGVEEFLRNEYPQVIFLRNFKNLGFARAHNMAIELAESLWAKQGDVGERFVLVTNPDIILTPNYLETILAETEAHPEAGSFGGMLYKVFEKFDGEMRESIRSNMIDTTGIKLFKTGRIVERGAGEENHGQFGKQEEVFGFSGALGFYRLNALKDVAVNGEIFDDAFFAYKEDVDLAWRLRRRGWRAWYVPEATAYHYRGAYGSEKRSFLQAWRERRNKSSIVNKLSYRNHVWLMTKNMDTSTFFLYAPFLLPYEVLKFCYLVIFECGTFSAFFEAMGGMGNMLKKRRFIMKNRKVTARDIRAWFA